MDIKKDESGNAVLKDGLPVFTQDDGTEITVNPDTMFTKIKELNAEAKNRRLEVKAISEKFESLNGIENIVEWKEKADKAITLAANLDNSDFIKAGEVEELKKQLQTGFETDKQSMIKQFAEAKDEFNQAVKEKDNNIFNLMVSSQFATSEYFSGTNPKTILPANVAQSHFKDHFSVKKTEAGKLIVVGKDKNGAVITGLDGEPANFQTAIKKIVEESDMKAQIMRSSGGGSGSYGGGHTGDGDESSKIEKQYKEAMKNGNARAAIALKNRLFSLKQNKK